MTMDSFSAIGSMTAPNTTADSLQSRVLPAATGRKWPLPEDWERHSGLIKRLYVDEDKTLNEVMAIMEEYHGHRAT